MHVLSHPNPALKQRASDVDPVTDAEIRPLAERMARTMYEAPGVGLAATQVGVMKRVIVYDLEDETGLIGLCNPVLVERSKEQETDEEGCLSLPGITVPVSRSRSVVCQALSLDGTPLRIEATDLHARVLQHEIDHLDGVLIIDRADPEDRKAALKRYRDLQERSL